MTFALQFIGGPFDGYEAVVSREPENLAPQIADLKSSGIRHTYLYRQDKRAFVHASALPLAMCSERKNT